jgi:Flp pilus assembly secretin CpaC
MPIMRHTLAAAAVFGLCATQALAGTVSVPMDEVRTVTFPRPVTTVFMGNSTIADVNLIDSRHAFVLGKVFGTTNLIALDSTGREVSNTYVAVPETRGATVTVFRGGAQLTLSCGGPRCNVSPVPGDAGYQDKLHDVEAHHELGAKQAQ